MWFSYPFCASCLHLAKLSPAAILSVKLTRKPRLPKLIKKNTPLRLFANRPLLSSERPVKVKKLKAVYLTKLAVPQSSTYRTQLTTHIAQCWTTLHLDLQLGSRILGHKPRNVHYTDLMHESLFLERSFTNVKKRKKLVRPSTWMGQQFVNAADNFIKYLKHRAQEDNPPKLKILIKAKRTWRRRKFRNKNILRHLDYRSNPYLCFGIKTLPKENEGKKLLKWALRVAQSHNSVRKKSVRLLRAETLNLPITDRIKVRKKRAKPGRLGYIKRRIGRFLRTRRKRRLRQNRPQSIQLNFISRRLNRGTRNGIMRLVHEECKTMQALSTVKIPQCTKFNESRIQYPKLALTPRKLFSPKKPQLATGITKKSLKKFSGKKRIRWKRSLRRELIKRIVGYSSRALHSKRVNLTGPRLLKIQNFRPQLKTSYLRNRALKKARNWKQPNSRPVDALGHNTLSLGTRSTKWTGLTSQRWLKVLQSLRFDDSKSFNDVKPKKLSTMLPQHKGAKYAYVEKINTHLLKPRTSYGFARSPFFFFKLFTNVDTKLGKMLSYANPWDRSKIKYLVFPKANDIKTKVFRRLNKQKLLFQSRFLQSSFFKHRPNSHISRRKMRRKVTFGAIPTYIEMGLGYTTLLNQLPSVRYGLKFYRKENKNLRIRRIRFKPGYGRLWREGRRDAKEIYNLSSRYQYRLTPKLHKLYMGNRQNKDTGPIVNLEFALTTAKIVPDAWSVREILNSNYVYVNGYTCLNPNMRLFEGDFVQLIVNFKFYIINKWLKSWFELKLKRINKAFYRKFRPATFNKDIKVVRPLPYWFFDLQYTFCDIPKYFEVDYFTLSIFVLHERVSLEKWVPTKSALADFRAVNMYNWKYIT